MILALYPTAINFAGRHIIVQIQKFPGTGSLWVFILFFRQFDDRLHWLVPKLFTMVDQCIFVTCENFPMLVLAPRAIDQSARLQSGGAQQTAQRLGTVDL
jgi:hypothetical protein